MFESRPEVFAHNLETVPRIFKRIRPAFRYQRSLDVITSCRDFGLVTKSNLILGMGETTDGGPPLWPTCTTPGCDIVTITQYLRLRRAIILAPSCGRPSRCSARKTERLPPHMIGAFVPIVAPLSAVGAGLIGGFTATG